MNFKSLKKHVRSRWNGPFLLHEHMDVIWATCYIISSHVEKLIIDYASHNSDSLFTHHLFQSYRKYTDNSSNRWTNNTAKSNSSVQWTIPTSEEEYYVRVCSYVNRRQWRKHPCKENKKVWPGHNEWLLQVCSPVVFEKSIFHTYSKP